VNPLNSPLEVGVRALVLLAEAYPDPLDIAQLVVLDHVLLHSGEFEGPPSLHPDLPVREGELGMKRTVLEQALLVLIRAHLARIEDQGGGITYTTTDRGPAFVDVLESSYVRSLRERAEWVIHHYHPGMNTRTATRAIINRALVSSGQGGHG
jgi:hypothetical protein